ncbi:enoyl-CoA hydratase/isomerase family protein [Erythrobacter mangrovi]|uniref:Enoyl-CoA hydratase/isomerase family protein n=1 Tax=Erythrobacter mangrovi TaxID=2739433 RepID=A0A7D3XHY6_9SPHN|nr:enoyl-CoA hydratase/isomerase family protein [Erythrobacter mangrovi]QKG71478.1 enoyl-CoA hydratase/isomerase family protein [Erythrobacter mangrovi]
MTGTVSALDDSGVRLLTISNPPRGYLNAALSEEILEHLRAALAEDAVRAIVFTGGVPGVFIRHYDVGEIVAVGEAMRSAPSGEAAPRSATPIYALADLLLDNPKPTIAAINGICMGGGCEFALACDMRIAATGGYTIGLPETRLGIIPGLGGMQMLARKVGLARATEMVMRGRVVGPDEAQRIGLVDFIAEDAVAAAVEIARDLATLSPVAVATVKGMAARIASGETLQEGIAATAGDFAHTLTADDEAMARMRRFLAEGENILSQ